MILEAFVAVWSRKRESPKAVCDWDVDECKAEADQLIAQARGLEAEGYGFIQASMEGRIKNTEAFEGIGGPGGVLEREPAIDQQMADYEKGPCPPEDKERVRRARKRLNNRLDHIQVMKNEAQSNHDVVQAKGQIPTRDIVEEMGDTASRRESLQRLFRAMKPRR
ncbi:MAG: hypothetical protein AAGA56_15580 [Myxococcota bacterium]